MCYIYTSVLLEFLPGASITFKKHKFQMFINKSNPLVFFLKEHKKQCFLLWQPSCDWEKRSKGLHRGQVTWQDRSPDLSDARSWASVTVFCGLHLLWKTQASVQGQCLLGSRSPHLSQCAARTASSIFLLVGPPWSLLYLQGLLTH